MQTKEIKTKIRSVGNIKKITKTMEMVSVAKMRKTSENAQASRSYAMHALELLAHISDKREQEHPYLDGNDSNDTLLVIIGSNKGLCGGYNVNINKAVKSFLLENDTTVKAVTIGKQAEKIARRNSLPVVASFTEFGDQVTADESASVSKVLEEQFSNGDFGNVVVVYTRFIKAMNYEVTTQPFLPVQPDQLSGFFGATDESSSENLALYAFEPSESDILNNVLPGLLTAVLYQTLLESAASEHSSRMVAMKGATENAGNLLDDLKLSYNKARQEAITREISEIAAGGEATSVEN
jgi:F-type H+-transporting ATPase subunit gamma